MAKEKEKESKPRPKAGLEILGSVFGFGTAQSASLLAEYKLDEKAVTTAFESGGVDAVSKLINDAADKRAEELAAIEVKKKPDPVAPVV